MLYQDGPLHVQPCWDEQCNMTHDDVSNPSDERPPLEVFLGNGVEKAGDKPFPTSVRWIERKNPPPMPAGLDG
eukprot:5045602-Karenia_brevis.AAC.1